MIYQFIAFAQLFLIVFGVPELLKWVYPQHHEESKLFLVSGYQIVHVLAWIVFNSYYFLLYSLNHPSIEKYKVEKLPWLWVRNPEEWKNLRNKTLLNFIRHIIVAFAFGMIQSQQRSRQDYDYMPSTLEVCIQLVFCIFVEDLMFYTTHRMLHHPLLYRFHKQHHEYNVTGIYALIVVSIASEYCSEPEYLAGNIIPVMIGPAILGMRAHHITVLTWIVLRIYKTLSSHCGYSLPWDPFTYIPYSTTTEYHSFHHSQNDGNFSSLFTFWDQLFGTSKYYNSLKQKQKQKQ